MNLPDYQFLSAPLWLISTLHIVTLTLHFVAMNFLVGGVIVMLFGKFEDKWNHPVVLRFVKLFPSAMAATVTLGVAPLLFVQLVYSTQIYSASIVSAWPWLMIFVVAMIAYYFLYGGAYAPPGSRRTGLYLSIALVGFVYISFVYSSIFSLAERPDLMATVYAQNQTGLTINPDVGSYIFRWLHMLLGAITIGGFFVSWIGRDNEPAYKIGQMFFLYGMVAAVVTGMIYMMLLGDNLLLFMRSPAIWLVTLSLVLSAYALHLNAKKKFKLAATLLFVSLLSMVTTRHIVRLILLGDTYDAGSVPIRTDLLPLALFVVCFVSAIGVIWYMMKIFFADRAAEHKS